MFANSIQIQWLKEIEKKKNFNLEGQTQPADTEDEGLFDVLKHLYPAATVASIISNETSYHILLKCHPSIQCIKIAIETTNSFEFSYQASILLMNAVTGWKNDTETHTNK